MFNFVSQIDNVALALFFGVLAIPIAIMKFQWKSRETILLFNIIGGILIGMQFLFLHQYAGSTMAYVTSVTGVVAYLYGRQLSWKIKPVFIVMVVLVLYWINPKSLDVWWKWLPLMATALGRVAEMQNNHRKMRIIFLPTHFLWFCYGIITQAWPTIIIETLTTISNLVGLFRHKK